MSHNIRKLMHTAKIQISLLISSVWWESSLGEFWILGDAKYKVKVSRWTTFKLYYINNRLIDFVFINR